MRTQMKNVSALCGSIAVLLLLAASACGVDREPVPSAAPDSGALTQPVTPPPSTACVTDRDCGKGLVCEPTNPVKCSDASSRQCVAGCRKDSDCAADQLCDQIKCDTCPCSGTCKAKVVKTACGTNHWCDSSKEICQIAWDNSGDSLGVHQCVPVPQQCLNDRTCKCLGSSVCTVAPFKTCTQPPPAAPANTVICECPNCD